MAIKLGAHVSAAGGFPKALERLHAIGGQALQIFSSSPRSWNTVKTDGAAVRQFVSLKKELNLGPVYFHASYLVNLADDSRVGASSVKSLTAELNLASAMEVKGSIVHLGSFKNENNEVKYPVLIANIGKVLEETPANTLFIIENAGNRKIGQSLDEIGRIIRDLGNPRVRVCLDTCHLHSAGYDLGTPPKLDAFLKEFDAKIGLHLLEVWHANDSRDPFASFHDRHENIGQGTLGLEPFRLLLNHPRMQGLPFIIETPGFDGRGPDLKNLDILRKLL